MAYLPRVVDSELDRLLGDLPAVAIDGPKGVGKTATALRRAARTIRLDRPEELELVRADPSLTVPDTTTLLVDEWQRYPPVWDAIRRAVDDGAAAGSYLLTGNAAPVGAPVHSGAGRIVRLRMRPLSLAERGLEPTTVSLADLLSGSRPLPQGESRLTLTDYVEELLASGFPGIRFLPRSVRTDQLDAYVERIVTREFSEQGAVVRRPATLRAWLTSYAAATATTASYTSILDAATAGTTSKPAKTTTTGYRDVLAQLWLVEPVPGWLPTRRPLARLTQAPKHHLADPALAAAILGVDQAGLRSDPALLGHLLESLVTLGVRVYAQAAGARVHHLRTAGGDHEVDLIVERRDRRVLAIEVKLAPPDDRDVRHLHWLQEQLGDDVVDAIVLTTGTYAYRRPDGIAVIPASLLGP